MTRAVVFRTPGLIDLQAFTMFGVSAKPLAITPIGRFGTGLKYAVAVLLREGMEIQLFRGRTQYEFKQKDSKFRDQKITTIELRRNKIGWWDHQDLPFTLDYGKDWELWMAFRELYANTLDEGGQTFVEDWLVNLSDSDKTYIVVTGERFVEEYFNRERTFLPDALMKRDSTEVVQRFDRPSKYVYYRGMRVMDLQTESKYTYNILREISLTEDRTAKYDWEVRDTISKYIAESTDRALIKDVISQPADTFEAKLDFNQANAYPSFTPSKEFIETSQANRGRTHVNASATDYVKRFDPPPAKDERPYVIQLREAIDQREGLDRLLDLYKGATLVLIDLAIAQLQSTMELYELKDLDEALNHHYEAAKNAREFPNIQPLDVSKSSSVIPKDDEIRSDEEA